MFPFHFPTAHANVTEDRDIGNKGKATNTSAADAAALLNIFTGLYLVALHAPALPYTQLGSAPARLEPVPISISR